MLDKVVLIDDDEVTLILCEFIIERYEFARQVIKLKNGAEGLEYFGSFLENDPVDYIENPPKLIFLDLNMPVLNGWDFLEDFCTQYLTALPQTKVIILSSTIDPEDFKRAMKYDVVVDFLNKPLNDASIEKLRANAKLQHLFSEDYSPAKIVK